MRFLLASVLALCCCAIADADEPTPDEVRVRVTLEFAKRKVQLELKGTLVVLGDDKPCPCGDYNCFCQSGGLCGCGDGCKCKDCPGTAPKVTPKVAPLIPARPQGEGWNWDGRNWWKYGPAVSSGVHPLSVPLMVRSAPVLVSPLQMGGGVNCSGSR
jgi:hypothetical protein